MRNLPPKSVSDVFLVVAVTHKSLFSFVLAAFILFSLLLQIIKSITGIAFKRCKSKGHKYNFTNS